jgi:hypothetical protein
MSTTNSIRIGTRVRTADGRVGTVGSYVPGLPGDAIAHVTFDHGTDNHGRPVVSAAWFGREELEVVS